MSAAANDPVELARSYLSQRAELAGQPWLLEGNRRADVLAALRSAGRARSAPAPGSGDEPGSASGPRVASTVGAPATSGLAAGASKRAVPGGGAAPAGASGAVDLESVTGLDELAALVASCTRCPLHATRTNAVFGEGDPNARVVCVGEAPGAREDATGRPFVGRAGQLLDRLLLTIGLPRESVYICNVLKSRPPNNRDPLPDEVAACSPYLVRQLGLIRPEVVLAFGAFAARTLLEKTAALGRLRGRVHEYAGYPVVVTYHPAALLRNPGWTRATWEDLQIVRALLDGTRRG